MYLCTVVRDNENTVDVKAVNNAYDYFVRFLLNCNAHLCTRNTVNTLNRALCEINFAPNCKHQLRAVKCRNEFKDKMFRMLIANAGTANCTPINHCTQRTRKGLLPEKERKKARRKYIRSIEISLPEKHDRSRR